MPHHRRTLAAWFGTAVLLTLCLLPKSWMPVREDVSGARLQRVPHLDKVFHFGMFAAFGLLWAQAGVPSRRRSAVVLGAAFALAVGTELAQGLPQIGRDPDHLDAIADALGAVAGVGIGWAAGALARAEAGTVVEPTGG